MTSAHERPSAKSRAAKVSTREILFTRVDSGLTSSDVPAPSTSSSV